MDEQYRFLRLPLGGCVCGREQVLELVASQLSKAQIQLEKKYLHLLSDALREARMSCLL